MPHKHYYGPLVVKARQIKLWRDDLGYLDDNEVIVIINNEMWLHSDPDRPKFANWFEQYIEMMVNAT